MSEVPTCALRVGGEAVRRPGRRVVARDLPVGPGDLGQGLGTADSMSGPWTGNVLSGVPTSCPRSPRMPEVPTCVPAGGGEAVRLPGRRVVARHLPVGSGDLGQGLGTADTTSGPRTTHSMSTVPTSCPRSPQMSEVPANIGGPRECPRSPRMSEVPANVLRRPPRPREGPGRRSGSAGRLHLALDDLGEAHRAIENRTLIGKALLRVS
jgi:hypothetical protein